MIRVTVEVEGYTGYLEVGGAEGTRYADYDIDTVADWVRSMIKDNLIENEAYDPDAEVY